RAAAPCTRKRSPVPPASPATASPVAKKVAAFFQPASTAAGASAQPHGNLGAPDTESEAAGPPALSAVQAVAARPPPSRQPGDSRDARPDARTARPAHQLPAVQERVFAVRTRPAQRGVSPSARPRRRSARGTARIVQRSKDQRKGDILPVETRLA